MRLEWGPAAVSRSTEPKTDLTDQPGFNMLTRGDGFRPGGGSRTAEKGGHVVLSQSARDITSGQVTSRHITSHHITPRHVTSRHVTPRHVTSRQSIQLEAHLPRVATVACGCVLVPIGCQAMGAAQQIVEVLSWRMHLRPIGPASVPAPGLASGTHTTAHSFGNADMHSNQSSSVKARGSTRHRSRHSPPQMTRNR